MPEPLVSVVIPCYNNASYVGEAIESVLRQSHKPKEIIVIDDGSTDDSLDVIRSFGDRITWQTGENQGGPAARNRGLHEARGRYVKFLDADDVLVEGALAQQVEQARHYGEERVAVFGRGRYVNEAGASLDEAAYRAMSEGEDPVAYILQVNPQTSLPLHRRDALLAVDGFDERLPRAQEYDLHFRLLLDGVTFHYEPTLVTLIRRHESTARITNQDHFGADPLAKLERLRHRERLIRGSGTGAMTEPVRRVLAQDAWQGGRKAVRKGERKAARNYFTYARVLHTKRHIDGASRSYRWCVRLVGPLWAERMGEQARKLMTLLRKLAPS